MKKVSLYSILVFGILTSILAYWFSMENIKLQTKLKFDTLVKESAVKVSSRMHTYKVVLYSGKGLFNASDDVSKNEWHTFVSTLKLEKDFPGIQGFGYSKVLQKDQTEKQSIITSIVYLEPENSRNARAMGYDMYSQETRREAMDRAIESLEAATSGKVRLLQENGIKEQAGFLIYVPVFKSGLPLTTYDEKIAALEGFVYAPFRVNDLLDGILGEQQNNLSLTIYDNEKLKDNILYQTSDRKIDNEEIHEDVKLNVLGRTWILCYTPSQKFLQQENRNDPFYILLFGFSTTVALFLFLQSIVNRRELAQEIADKMTRKFYNQQERLNNVINGTNLGTWEWGITTGRTIFNENWAEMLGYKLEELLPTTIKTWEELVHPDDLIKSKQILSKHMNGEIDHYLCEIRMKHKDGRWIWILDQGKIMSTKDNDDPLWMYGTHQNITKRKEAEIQLIKEKNFSEAMINDANSVIAIIDASGTMIRLNQYGQDFTGYSEKEISREPYFWSCLLLDTQKDQVIQAVQNIKKNGIEKRIKNSWISKTGEEKIFLWSNTLIKNNNGEFDYILTVGINITEQEQQRLKIEEQKEEFEAIFKTTKDGIAILDLDMKYLECNEAYLTMLGYTKEELVTKSCQDLVTSEKDNILQKDILDTVFEFGFIENIEKSCITKNGSTIYVNMSISLFPDHKRLLVTTKNITQNKILESQAKLASMGEMIGNIAHQWRQPLTVISMLADGTNFKKSINRLQDKELTENMNQICEQAMYLSKTIDDFKNFIKGDKEAHHINVEKLIAKTMTISSAILKSHLINTVINIDSDVAINGYENELVQAFLNIINNSKDALIEKVDEADLRLIFIETKKLENEFQIIFKDNGGGIPNNVINRIFEPYFTTKHQSIGTGLGLSMTYKIITEHHQGKISVQNTKYQYNEIEYEGAMFVLSFFKFSKNNES